MLTRRRYLPVVILSLALAAAACADEALDTEAEAAVEDLGRLAAKADGVTLREVKLTLGAGEIKRYRITTIGLRASLAQAGNLPVQLSARNFDIDIFGDVSAEPTVEAVSPDGSARTWTLRVHNQGDETLEAEVNVLEWVPPPQQDLLIGVLGDELRREPVSLAAGEIKRFRIVTTRFHAALTQTTDTLAALSAKHYEIDIAGEPGLQPTVDAVADVDALRHWTLRVENLGAQRLEGEVVVHQLVGAEHELGIVSDIDKTLLPPKVNGQLPPPYPGVVSLFRELEFGGGGTAGDFFFVTARTETGVAEVPAWMDQHDVPEGPISTGVSGIPWIAQAEKVRDLSEILEANPEQRFVLFGDSNHRDPEAYNEVIERFPGRIVAGFIHEIKPTSAGRLGRLNLIQNYAQAAAILFGVGVLDERQARNVIADARAEGVALSDADVEALLDAQRALGD